MGDNTICCPWERQCQKLQIVVLTTKPWAAPPGGYLPSTPEIPYRLPSRGVCGGIRLSATGCVGIPGIAADLPASLLTTYQSTSHISVMNYDFAKTYFCSGEGNACIIARGKANCTQASLTFKYRWCGTGLGTGTCFSPETPRFELLKCTYNGLIFNVIDSQFWISSNKCVGSIVVLGLQQLCCLPGLDSCISGVCTYAALPCASSPSIPPILTLPQPCAPIVVTPTAGQIECETGTCCNARISGTPASAAPQPACPSCA